MVRFAVLTGCLALSLAAPVQGAGQNRVATCPVTTAATPACAQSWASGNRFMVRGTSPQNDRQVEWHYEFAANRDLKIEIRGDTSRTKQAGALLLIDNRTMVSRDLPLPNGQEHDAFGVPVLALQLVVDLLDRAIPGGPVALEGRRTVDIADGQIPLAIAAGDVNGMVPAPWALAGTVTRGSDSRVEFDLTLSFKAMLDGAKLAQMRLSGYWDKRPNAPVLPDSTKIEGWAVHLISHYSDANAGRALSGLRTTRVVNHFATLGAIRRHFSGENTEAEQ